MSSILWLIETFVFLFLCIKYKIIIPINAVINDGTSAHIKIKFKGLNFDSVSSFEIVEVNIELIEVTVRVSSELLIEVLVDVLMEVVVEVPIELLLEGLFDEEEVLIEILLDGLIKDIVEVIVKCTVEVLADVE